MDPRQIFCLIAIAVRVAQRLGLHRDPALLGLSPFEVEQRRRLWWTIVAYDGRIGEMTGATVTALSFNSDTKFPLNINDTDLHVDGKEPPLPHAGATEMIFCLARLELSLIVRSNSNRDEPIKVGPPPSEADPGLPTPASSTAAASTTPAPNSGTAGSETPNPAGPPPLPIPTVRSVARENISYTLEGFTEHIENQYLRHCDERIPLHFFTLTMTRQMLLKMRILAFLVRLGHGDAPPGASGLGMPGREGSPQQAPLPFDDAKRDELFFEAIRLIEYDVVLQEAPSLRPYKWFTYVHFPFPAYMFLVNELRRRTTGALVERAWEALTISYQRRDLVNKLHNPMHMAFGRLFIKAWDAHATAQREVAGREVVQPAWLATVRAHVERSKRRAGGPGAGGGGPNAGDGRMDDGFSASSFTGSSSVPPMPAFDAGLPQYPQTLPTAAPLINPHASLREREEQRRQVSSVAGGSSAGPDLNDMDWSYVMQEYEAGGLADFGPRPGIAPAGPGAGSLPRMGSGGSMNGF